MARFVLDASALLALIQLEKGAERITQALEQGECIVSAVNLSEALAKLVTAGLPEDQAEAVVLGIPAEVVPCDERIALQAGRLAIMGKPLGLSLGDRVCLATGLVHGGTVLTKAAAAEGSIIKSAVQMHALGGTQGQEVAKNIMDDEWHCGNEPHRFPIPHPRWTDQLLELAVYIDSLRAESPFRESAGELAKNLLDKAIYGQKM